MICIMGQLKLLELQSVYSQFILTDSYALLEMICRDENRIPKHCSFTEFQKMVKRPLLKGNFRMFSNAICPEGGR